MNSSVYTRPNKPSFLRVKKREEAPSRALPRLPKITEIHKSSECHITPNVCARTMVEVLEAGCDQLTIEPSAGNGSLVSALLDSGHSPSALTMVERSRALCKCLTDRFSLTGVAAPLNDCFLNYVETEKRTMKYPRILMNAPFSKSKQHLRAALDILGDDEYDRAVLVALVPITLDHEEAELIEILPSNTFVTAAVNSKIIRIIR